MKKIGYWLVNVLLVLIFIFTCAGAFAEKNMGFGIVCVITVVLFFLNIKRHNKNVISGGKKAKEMDAKYNDWKKIGSFADAHLYINENTKQVVINDEEYNFKDIVSVELLENEKQYGSSVTTKGIGKSLITSSGTTDYCTKLQIKVVLNSITNSQEYITFLNKGKTWKSTKKYKQAYDMAQKFLSTLQVIVNNNKN